MKAVKITGIRQVDVTEVNEPQELKNHDVKVQIRSVGVCGSDIHYYSEGSIGSQVLQYPWGVGHEAAGEVVACGSKVRNLKIGDKVAIEPTIYCGQCSECKNDRRHTCLNQRFLGCPGQAEGCMSEYYIMPDYCCIKVTDQISSQLIVLAEPLSIGLYAAKLSEITDSDKKIAILGAGPIGLSVLASCRYFGQEQVVMTEPLKYRQDFAIKMGAQMCLHSDDEVELNADFDVVYECCGKQEALDQALHILKPGGKLMFVGIPETKHLQFNMDLMRRKEICVQNVRRQNNSFEEAIAMIEANPAYYQQMITHNYSFKEAGKAFETVSNYKDDVIKAMVNF